MNRQNHASFEDKFRDSFKYYKKRKPPPSLDDVIDFGQTKNEKVVQVALNTDNKKSKPWLVPPEKWKVYTHLDLPGLLYISNPFAPGWQMYWAKRCLCDYHTLPNKCNLDAHICRIPGDNVWQQSVEEHRKTGTLNKTLIDKLRWVTLGYHHDWDTKEYSEENCSPFPEDLAELSFDIASVLGFENFQAQASIVNYYHLDSTLAGHTDHSELYLQAPLFSISLGQSAIFLLGGETKSTRPVAMFLHSGDIVVMSGKARLAYHAVPKILPPTSRTIPECLKLTDANVNPYSEFQNISADEGFASNSTPGCLPDKIKYAESLFSSSEDLRCVEEYLRRSRINLNVRQVFKCGQKLPKTKSKKLGL